MNRKYLLFIVFIIALLAVTPALAREHEPTGERINLGYGDQSFSAGAPFHILHGWWVDIWPRNPPGQQFFELEVDGVYVKPTFTDFQNNVDPVEGYHYITRLFYFNFPEGMTGQHTFEGHWILACHDALEEGWVDECDNPMADFEAGYISIVVTFE